MIHIVCHTVINFVQTLTIRGLVSQVFNNQLVNHTNNDLRIPKHDVEILLHDCNPEQIPKLISFDFMPLNGCNNILHFTFIFYQCESDIANYKL